MAHYSELKGAITISPALTPEHQAILADAFADYCPWRISDDGSQLLPPLEATPNAFAEELQQLLSTYFQPWSYRLDGNVRWECEDSSSGTLRVTASQFEVLHDEEEPLSPEGIAQVLEQLKSRNPDDIRVAGDIMDYYRSNFNLQFPGACEILVHHLSDSVMEVRWQAATCLMVLGAEAEPAIPALIHALNDSHEWVRSAAAAALGAIGAKAAQAIPALEHLLNDSSYGPRGRAQQALERIRGTIAHS